MKEKIDVKSLTLQELLDAIKNQFPEEGEWIVPFVKEHTTKMGSVTELLKFTTSVKTDMEELDLAEANSFYLNCLRSEEEGEEQQPQSLKLIPYCSVALFLRECIAAVEDMSFEDMSQLAADIKQYCKTNDTETPSDARMDDEPTLVERFEAVESNVRVGRWVPQMDRVFDAIRSAGKETTDCMSSEHEVALLKKDFDECLRTLNRYLGNACNDLGSSEDDNRRISHMCLKMANVYNCFNQYKTSVDAISEAFKAGRIAKDEKALLLCYTAMIHVILKQPHLLEDEEHRVTLQKHISFCFERSKTAKVPHMLVFALLAKMAFAFKCGIIESKSYGAYDVHRFLMSCDNSARQLCDHILATTHFERVHKSPNDTVENSNELVSVFHQKLRIFGNNLIVFKSLAPMLNHILASMQMYVAASWRRLGQFGNSKATAISSLVSFDEETELSDRADAIVWLIHILAERQGFLTARRAFEFATRNLVSIQADTTLMRFGDIVHYICATPHPILSEENKKALVDFLVRFQVNAPSALNDPFRNEENKNEDIENVKDPSSIEMSRTEKSHQRHRWIQNKRNEHFGQWIQKDVFLHIVDEPSNIQEPSFWTLENIIQSFKEWRRCHTMTLPDLEALMSPLLPFVLRHSTVHQLAEFMNLFLESKIAKYEAEPFQSGISDSFRHNRITEFLKQLDRVLNLDATANSDIPLGSLERSQVLNAAQDLILMLEDPSFHLNRSKSEDEMDIDTN